MPDPTKAGFMQRLETKKAALDTELVHCTCELIEGDDMGGYSHVSSNQSQVNADLQRLETKKAALDTELVHVS